jgi:hypothetical protein
MTSNSPGLLRDVIFNPAHFAFGGTKAIESQFYFDLMLVGFSSLREFTRSDKGGETNACTAALHFLLAEFSFTVRIRATSYRASLTAYECIVIVDL